MRHELYQGVYATVKRFITEEDFYIRFLLPADFFIYTQNIDNPVSRCTFANLRFNKANGAFYIENIVAELMPKQIYNIIKNYVLEEIAREQKEIFNGSFEYHQSSLNNSYYLLLSNKQDLEDYCEIIDMFKPFLWDEMIEARDISKRGCMPRLAFGFPETKGIIDFLSELLNIFHKYDEIFITGKIQNYMLDELKIYANEKLDYFSKLESEKYLVIEKKDDCNIIQIALTSKFYEAFKKSFYYDYDPRCNRPYGCINN